MRWSWPGTTGAGEPAGLAAALPDRDLEIVGPTIKVADEDLPQADNIRWLGGRPYEELPFDDCRLRRGLMPFRPQRGHPGRSAPP